MFLTTAHQSRSPCHRGIVVSVLLISQSLASALMDAGRAVTTGRPTKVPIPAR